MKDDTAVPAGDGPVTREEFEELRARVDALIEDRERHRRVDPLDASDGFWALKGLRSRLEEPAGGILFTGAVELEPGVPHAWQQGATTESLLATDWSEVAPALDALGHPVRLQLLQLVASGVHRTAELGEAEGLGTSGQLHHHLRQLVAAGWLRSAGRGSYEVPAARVVPLLVVLTAAQR